MADTAPGPAAPLGVQEVGTPHVKLRFDQVLNDVAAESRVRGDLPVFGVVPNQVLPAGGRSRFVSGNLNLVAPVNAEGRHVVVQQILLLVVAYHHQHVQLGVVQLPGQVGNGLLVLLVPLLKLLGGYFLRYTPRVAAGQQFLEVGSDAVGAD